MAVRLTEALHSSACGTDAYTALLLCGSASASSCHSSLDTLERETVHAAHTLVSNQYWCQFTNTHQSLASRHHSPVLLYCLAWSPSLPAADGDEGGRHQLIGATVSNGKLWIIKVQVGDKRWFKGAKKEALGAFNSFTVA